MRNHYVITSLLGRKWYSIARERCWVPACVSRINGDRTFGATGTRH
jgi:hypothetical protein